MTNHEKNIVDDLKMIDVLLGKAMSETLKDDGVTPAQAGVLLLLAGRQDTSTSLRDIEKHFNISNPAASTMAKRLEARGFVKTSVDQTDKRRHNVVITAEGIAAIESADRKVKALDKVIFAGFTPEDEQSARHFISQILKNLESRS